MSGEQKADTPEPMEAVSRLGRFLRRCYRKAVCDHRLESLGASDPPVTSDPDLMALIAGNAVVDLGFYARQVGLAGKQASDLAGHLIEEGLSDGLKPNPIYDHHFVRWLTGKPDPVEAFLAFLDGYPDVYTTCSPLFDAGFYRQVVGKGFYPSLPALEVFLAFWRDAPGRFSPLFLNAFYTHLIGTDAIGNPLIHYCELPLESRGDFNPHFCIRHYQDTYRDYLVDGIDPFCHFLIDGSKRGFRPNAVEDFGVEDALAYSAREMLLERLKC